jgi:hypothetical protein
MTLRGRVQNGVVLLPTAAGLPEGTLVDVTPLADHAGTAPSSAILASLENLPKVPPEWVDELARLIAEGRRPPSPPVVFPDGPGVQENG